MGLLDSLAGSLLSSLSGNQQSNLTSNILQMLIQNAGGISGLVQSFTKNGLGDVISSWIGTGQNAPITADQLTNIFGKAQLQQLAQSSGIPQEQAGSVLADLLPRIIDNLTPDGKEPEGDLMNLGESLLKGKLF